MREFGQIRRKRGHALGLDDAGLWERPIASASSKVKGIEQADFKAFFYAGNS